MTGRIFASFRGHFYTGGYAADLRALDPSHVLIVDSETQVIALRLHVCREWRAASIRLRSAPGVADAIDLTAKRQNYLNDGRQNGDGVTGDT